MMHEELSAEVGRIIQTAFEEDVRDGDHTSLSTIGEGPRGKARLLVKEEGILAGVEVAKAVFAHWDAELEMEVFNKLKPSLILGPA